MSTILTTITVIKGDNKEEEDSEDYYDDVKGISSSYYIKETNMLLILCERQL